MSSATADVEDAERKEVVLLISTIKDDFERY